METDFIATCRKITAFNGNLVEMKRAVRNFEAEIQCLYPAPKETDYNAVFKAYREEMRQNKACRDLCVCAILYLLTPEVLCGELCKGRMRRRLAEELNMTMQGVSRIVHKVAEHYLLYSDFSAQVTEKANSYLSKKAIENE